MASDISFIIQAQDKFSAPARRIKAAMQGVTQGAKKSTAAFKRMSQSMDKIGKTAGRVGREMKKTSASSSFFTSRIAALGGVLLGATGIRSLVRFDQNMANIRAKTDATSEEFKKMRTVIKKLGAETVFSASQVAEGMEFLVKAGIKSAEAIKVLPVVLSTATAAGIELGQAADIVSKSMSGFGLEGKDATRIADVLAVASNSVNTTMVDLAQAMKFVSTGSADLGLKFETTTAALATLQDAGIDASSAGTGLRRLFVALQTPTKKNAKLLRGLGLTFKDVNLKTNKFSDVIKKFGKTNIDLGKAVQFAGLRAGPALLALIRKADKLTILEEKFLNAKGAAKKMADIMSKTLQGALKEALSGFESLIIATGENGLTGALTGLLKTFAKTFRAMGTFVDKNPLLLKTIGLTIAGIIGLKLAMLGLAGAMTLVRLLSGRLIFTALLVLGSIITVIISKLKELGVTSENFLEIVEDAFPKIAVVFKVLSRGFGGFARGLREIFDIIKRILNPLETLGNLVKTVALKFPKLFGFGDVAGDMERTVKVAKILAEQAKERERLLTEQKLQNAQNPPNTSFPISTTPPLPQQSRPQESIFKGEMIFTNNTSLETQLSTQTNIPNFTLEQRGLQGS